MFSEVAEIAAVTEWLWQFSNLWKHVDINPYFTCPQAITYTNLPNKGKDTVVVPKYLEEQDYLPNNCKFLSIYN